MRPTLPITALGIATFMSLFAVSQSVSAQDPTERDRPEVLILGVYHMSNPGNDVFNTEADDVLSARRQDEIAEVIDILAEFRPTRIAVEAGFSNDRVQERYAAYVAGEHELTRNEVDQIGFRLARELGHETVYPVDVDGEFPYPRLLKYAQATGRMPAFDSLRAEGAERSEASSAYLASHTVLETLQYMNSESRVAEAVGAYFQLAEFGEPWDWAGADLVSDWFRRNMRIYTNIARLADDESERILVIYGAGHLGWLQYAFASNPRFRLRELAELVERSSRP